MNRRPDIGRERDTEDSTVTAMRRLAQNMALRAEEHFSTAADRRAADLIQMVVSQQDQIAALTRRVRDLEAAIQRLDTRGDQIEEHRT